MTGDKEAETTIQTAAPYGTIFVRNSGAAVGNGGNHDQTDNPKPYYRPLSEIIP